MAVKKSPHIPTNMALIDMSGYDQRVVVTMDEAIALVKALEHAEAYESEGYGDSKVHYIGTASKEPLDLKVTILAESAYLSGKFAGPRPKAESND